MQKKLLLPYLIIICLLVTFSNPGIGYSSNDFTLNFPLIFNNSSLQQNAPTITSHPADQEVLVGQTASFSVSASGPGNLDYQWQRKNSGATTWANVGTDSASYTTAAVTLSDNLAQFRCLVSNSGGSVASKPATLNVTPISVTCYTLTLGHNGNGSNPSVSPVKSSSCFSDGQYAAGESISLTGAAPASGWQISSWTGTSNDASTAGNNSVTMPAAAHVVMVTYTPICYILTLTHTPAIGGTNPTAVPANSAGCLAGQYVAGESITLSGATPATGYQIGSWTGTNNDALITGSNSLTMLAAARTVSVNYSPLPPNCFALILSHTGNGSNPTPSPPTLSAVPQAPTPISRGRR